MVIFYRQTPADPLGRLFSTVTYARNIVFSEKEAAYKAIDKIAAIHSTVEANRGSLIPDWAYRDVLFMLIHYSIAAFELLERNLTIKEKEEVFDVFHRFGIHMKLRGLPKDYSGWLIMRKDHLNTHLAKGFYTIDLYKQYKKHLGIMRFKLLLESQKLIVPAEVTQLLNLGRYTFLKPALLVYKLSRYIKIDSIIKWLILPKKYIKEIKDLDVNLREKQKFLLNIFVLSNI